MRVEPNADDLGAQITDIDLREPLCKQQVQRIRDAWISHRVVYFPDQQLSHSDLARFTQYFGPFGHDPYVKPIDTHQNILEIRRNPDEPVPPFGSSWHSDWSFQAQPPSATLLHSKVVPPVGGDTHFCDCIAAYRALDQTTRQELQHLEAIHSARRPYSHEGFEKSGGRERSMAITPSDDAWATQYHPLVRTHPETGEQALWINPVYTIGIRGLTDLAAKALLNELFTHLLAPQNIYRHRWSANMLTMWDNRSVLHCAQGGYDGHLRIMHRTTVAGCAPFSTHLV